MAFAAVIFDLDGTLLDTERQAMAAGKRALAEQGHSLTEALFHSLVGMDEHAGSNLLRQAFGEIDMPWLVKSWRREVHIAQQDGIPLKPDTLEILDRVDRMGLPKAIATSSGAQSAASKLAISGLADRFEVVVTRDCVTQAKPAPEPYALAAARLGIAARRCLAFEDSLPGAQAAMAAGMTVVLVPDLTAPVEAPAHHIAPSLLAGADMAGLT